MEQSLSELLIVNELVLKAPVFSLFFLFNLLCFLFVAYVGAVRFFRNNYTVGRLPFCFAALLCIGYQLPLVLFSRSVELSLQRPWIYAMVVNGGALLLMIWVCITPRFDFKNEKSINFKKTTWIYLIAGISGVGFLWVYLSSVPWQCTGLYALLFDPLYTLLARELGVKLVGTSFATYSLGAYAGAVAPIFLLLSMLKIENCILRKRFISSLLFLFFGVFAVAALLISGTKGLFMPSALMLMAGAYFYHKTWHARLMAVVAAILFLFFSLFIFKLLMSRSVFFEGQYDAGGRYDFAVCAVSIGACQKSLSLLESMKEWEGSLGMPKDYIKPIESRLNCVCSGNAGVCPAGTLGFAIPLGVDESGLGGSGGVLDKFILNIKSTAYRIFAVPLQVSAWHFLYAETEIVDGQKTLPFAKRLYGQSLNMPELVYQKYGVIYSKGDKTSTSTAPTSFLFSYAAYLGLTGFGIALACVIGLDIVLSLLARFIDASLMPLLVGVVVIMSANFLVSDFVTVLLSHGAGVGVLMLFIFVFVKRLENEESS